MPSSLRTIHFWLILRHQLVGFHLLLKQPVAEILFIHFFVLHISFAPQSFLTEIIKRDFERRRLFRIGGFSFS